MGRVAATVILVVLLGVWVTPFIAGAGRPTAAAARDTLDPLIAATQASSLDPSEDNEAMYRSQLGRKTPGSTHISS